MRLILPLLLCILTPGMASAQMMVAPAPGSATQAATGGLAGRWSGMVLCGNRGWAIIHDVTDSNGALSSQYQFVGTSRGEAEVTILPNGPDRFVLDAVESNVYDYDVTLVEGQLIGTARGENCIVRLARFPETP